jgi:transposase InsO family protein
MRRLAPRSDNSPAERQNGSLRQRCKRLTRLTYAFSKKWENLKAALALHFAYYNFCRVHGSLRVTPAMEAGITDHVWTLDELVTA